MATTYHLPIDIPDRLDRSLHKQSYIFRPWGHLLQGRSEIFADIRDRFDRPFAEEVIYNTYNSNHINRYFSEDYGTVFDSSGFEFSEYQVTFPRNPTAEVQVALESRFPDYRQFGNNGTTPSCKSLEQYCDFLAS